ncbi:Transposase (fragment2) [Mycobacteroides abscessus subsp. abscessus]|nr:Transposase (fragment2) [Mycobacteroides abscessus subsp. abscessus]
MKAEAIWWSLQVAGMRNSWALDGGQPVRVFEALEAGELAPLPTAPFTLSVWSIGVVGSDTHMKIGKALYSVPCRLIGQRMHARTSGDIVQIFRDQNVVATHVLHLSRRATNLEHYPPEKIAFRLQGPTWCRKIAAEVGPACELVIGELLSPNAIHRLRAAQGYCGSAKSTAWTVWKPPAPAPSTEVGSRLGKPSLTAAACGGAGVGRAPQNPSRNEHVDFIHLRRFVRLR